MWHPGGINLLLMKPHAKIQGVWGRGSGTPLAICCSSFPPDRKCVVQVAPHNVCIVGWSLILLTNDSGKDTIQLKLWLQEQLQHVQIVCPGNCLSANKKGPSILSFMRPNHTLTLGESRCHSDEFIWLLPCPDPSFVSVDDATDMKCRFVAEHNMIH